MLGKHFLYWDVGNGKFYWFPANSLEYCNRWMCPSLLASKKKLHVANMKSNISRHETKYDFELWAKNTLTTIGSTFKTLDAKACFEKCGLTPRKDKIRESVLTYVKPDLLGHIRMLSKDELSIYIGKKGDHLHKFLFADAVPAVMQHAVVHNWVPHQRMSSKRSLHHD